MKPASEQLANVRNRRGVTKQVIMPSSIGSSSNNNNNNNNNVSLSLASCEDAIAIYSLLLSSSAYTFAGTHLSSSSSSSSRRRSKKTEPVTRLRLRIADMIVIDPATQEVRAHYFTSAKNGCVMRRNSSKLDLEDTLQALLKGLVRASCRRAHIVAGVQGWCRFVGCGCMHE